MKNANKFNFQPILSGLTLAVRPLRESDFEELYACASDKLIWENHRAFDRYQEAVFLRAFEDSIASNACVVFSEKYTDKLIGWSRYYVAEEGPDDISIGFTFLVRRHWGGASNKQLKTLMLNHAFKTFNCVCFHISPDNYRSQRAILKLGALLINQDLRYLGGKTGQWYSYKMSR